MLRLHTCSALFALSLAITACGGGGGSSPAPAPTPVQAAAIVTQPAPATATAGQAVTFAVTATGTGLSYQWQRDGKDIAGATAASYILNNVQTSDDGASFTVVVRNSAGSATSAAALLRVGGAKGLSLLAGGLGGPGNLDGMDGRFALPSIVAVSPSGLLVVGDNAREFETIGVRRTVDLATGAVATIKVQPLPWQLVAMVFDGAGNRYELSETAIYKTTPAGERSLLAGANQSGYADGAGAAARFGKAAGLAIDGAGNLYVTDDGNKTLRKVTPAGEVSTLAGTPGTQDLADGSGSAAHFRGLAGVTVDRAGNVYVLDFSLPRKITPAGLVTSYSLKVAGESGAGYVTATTGLAVDAAGYLYVADNNIGCRIRRIAPDGTVTDFAGKVRSFGNVDGKGDAARFCANYNSALGNLAIDSAGNLYVGDAGNQTIRRITPAAEVSTVAGRAPQVADVDGDGPAARFGLASELIPPPRDFYEPAYELTVDAQGIVYVGESDRIRAVSRTGAVSTLPGAAGAAAGTVYYGSGLAFDGSRLAVSNGVISSIDANGASHFLAGQAGVRGLADGAGARASFSEPNKLIMDGLGNVYLEDVLPTQLSRVIQRKIAADGTVTTLPPGVYQGSAWYAGRDGTVWVAKFDRSVVRIAPDGTSTVVRAAPAGNDRGAPTAIAVDRNGNLYVAEAFAVPASNGSTGTIVSKITPAGVESVIAGSAAWSGVRLGAPGSLGPVDALAVGEDGSLYVMSENAVLRLAP
jgi:sugar lactone lactonase YvrE